MDNGGESDSGGPCSTTKETTDDISYGGKIRPSEFAKQELKRIRDQLSANLERVSGSRNEGIPPSQDQCNLEVPTDLTVSDASNLADRLSCSVIFEAPKTRLDSSEYGKRWSHQEENKTAVERDSEPQPFPDMAHHENKRLAELKAAFDNLPSENSTNSISFAEFQQELTEKRYRAHKKISNLTCEAFVKAKEAEFLQHQLESVNTDLGAAKSEIAAKEAENRQLLQAMAQLESKSSGRILELTLDLQHKASKLETYERLYSQMNELSEGLPTSDRENIGVAIPVNLKYKLQHTMDLSQRLKEERDHLERCRDEADRRLRAMEAKYQGALIELNKLKIGEDMKLSNAKAALQLKCFELERVNIATEEYKERYKAAVEDNGALKKKVDCLLEDLNEVKNELTAEITRLSLELQSKSSRLELYEGIENSLDEMILKAAKIPDAHVGQDLLSFCTSGASLPTDARRRLQQAYDLAKRNCDLEKTVSDQKQEILTLYDERETLRTEIQDVKSLSGHSVGQLIDTITAKNREIGKLNNRIASMERDACEMKKSQELLQTTVDNLKSYQEQVLKLLHSGARVNQAKLDRQGQVTSTTNDSEPVSSKSSLRLAKTLQGSTSSTTTARLPNQPSNNLGLNYRPSVHRLRSNSSRTAPAVVESRPFLGPTQSITSSASAVLSAIAEEHGDEPFDSDFTFLTSASSVTSSMFGPPPRVLSSRIVRRIPAKPASGRSKKVVTAGSKPIPGRQVVSSDLVVEHTKKKEKNVPLRKSKVKPSASTFF